MDEDYGFVIDTMRWSFSRLNSFYNCPYEWKRVYIDCEPRENGFFGEFGSLCHSILEGYAKGEISIFEVSEVYEEEFNNVVVHDAPPNKYIDLRQSYFDKGLDYFNNFDLNLDRYEILGVERKVEFQIVDKDFVGFIDLLLRDKETDDIIILDHKSASLKFKKNGEISKKDADHYKDFQRQLYLYSLPIIEKYGKVNKLRWNMFKDQKEIEIPWQEEGCEEAQKWAKDTISLIEKEKDWAPNPDFYYCHYLCSQRNNCCAYKAG